jgi:hypothetical protein
MQIKIVVKRDHIPIRDPFRYPTLGGVNLIRVPCFASDKHLDSECRRSGIAKIDTFLAVRCGQKMDREPPVSVFLADRPSAVPVLMLDKVSNPIHVGTIAKLNNVGNAGQICAFMNRAANAGRARSDDLPAPKQVTQ